MPSTYSDLKIELINTGSQAGTWGVTTNTNLGTAIEEAVTGIANAEFGSDANLTLNYLDDNASQIFRNLVLNVTSLVSLTATRELVVPTIEKQYLVWNNTTGGQSITVKTSAGAGITVPNGAKAHLFVDGADVSDAVNRINQTNIPLNKTLVDTDSTQTLTNKTLAFGSNTLTDVASTNTTQTLTNKTINGAVNTITNVSLSTGITGVLPVVNGGTGSSNAAGARTNLNAVGYTALTGSASIPAGTEAQRDGAPQTGYFRFNTDTVRFEGFIGSSWAKVGVGATGGGNDEVFIENDQTVTTNYTITTGKNAMTTGPIEIDDGVVVTVPSGSRWVII